MIVRSVRKARRLLATAKFFLNVSAPPSLIVGPRIRVARGASLRTADRVSIGGDCTFMAHVEVGPDVMISSRVAFIGDDHPFQNSAAPITAHAARPLASILIEGDNLIGFGTIVIGPVIIGRGAIVGAGSVVTGDLQPDSVYAGTPARKVGPRRRAPAVHNPLRSAI